MGHTGTPWSQYMSGPMIHGADGFYIGIMQGKNADKDAAYIVECVNSHASLVEEVERLREALETFVSEYVEMVNSGDCGFWDPEKEDKVIAARKALEKSNA